MSLNNSDQSLKNIVSALLEYLLQIHMVNLDQEFSVEIYKDEQYVNIDQKAIRNLELFETLIDREKRGSLIYILDHASTQMGSRLLKQWLKRPLKDVEKIKKRHDIVEFLINSSIFNLEIISILSQISDIERIIAKVNYRTVLPKELIRLGESLFKISELKHLISKKAQLNYISSKLETFENLAHKILNTIKEDPTNNLSDGGYIREGVNVELDEINILIRDASKILLDLENREKENTGIKNLKIKYNKVFGYFFEISNGNLDRVPDYFIRKQTLVNNERFFTEELKNIEDKIVNAKDIKKELEDKIFKELIETINPYSTNIINSSQCISELDILSNFAQLSINNSWVRPQFNNKNELDIKEARHPVIENMIG